MWRQLAKVWPELEIVAEARNGREAVRLFDERHSDICFLDVHMPGLSGADVDRPEQRRLAAIVSVVTTSVGIPVNTTELQGED